MRLLTINHPNLAEDHKAINWVESTRRSIEASVPAAFECVPQVVDRLSVLLLERLPNAMAVEVLKLLPAETAQLLPIGLHAHWTQLRSAKPLKQLDSGDASIGFATFVEVTRLLLGVSALLDTPPYADSEDRYAALCVQVTEAFLWAIAQELPIDLKQRIAYQLPGDLRCRMNLTSGYSEHDRVA